MVAGLNRWLHRVSLGAAYLAAVALAVSVGVTVADIVLRRAIDTPIPGVVDLTQLCVMWAAFLSIPVAFHLDNHISVVLFTDRLGPVRRRQVFCAGAFASAVFLAVACWASAAKALQEAGIGDRSMILGSPAKVVRELSEENASRLAMSAESYVKRGQNYKANLKRIG